MHSPFVDDGSAAPQFLEEFSHPVKLPFTKGKVKNKMRSKAARNYLGNYWGKQLSISVATGPLLVGKANDIENPWSNQQAEGMINGEKTHVPGMEKHASDVGVYMWCIFNTLNESSKYVVAEMETLDKKWIAKQN